MAKKKVNKRTGNGWKPEPDIYDPFSTRIKRTLQEKLKSYCHKWHVSKQHVVNKAIEEYLKKQGG